MILLGSIDSIPKMKPLSLNKTLYQVANEEIKNITEMKALTIHILQEIN